MSKRLETTTQIVRELVDLAQHLVRQGDETNAVIAVNGAARLLRLERHVLELEQNPAPALNLSEAPNLSMIGLLDQIIEHEQARDRGQA